MDLWTLPEVKKEEKEGSGLGVEKIESMTSDEFVELGEEKITVPLRFDFYYSYEQVVEALRALNKAYPELTTLDLVGKSEENREIYALTVNNPKTGDALSKPGVYVDGNIHGNEIQAGEVCLYFLNQLLTKYGKNEKITKLVDKNAYYVLPIVNVDGRYHFFKDPNTSSSNRGLRRPKDDDRDGLFDEDFLDDLDGDGNITQMRKKDPYGRLKTDPEDPRLMVPVKPGEKGEWTMLGQEGIDNDGDGRVNEDSEGYVDGNRNWGFNWAPPYVQRGAGDFPLSGEGIRAIANYLYQHPNIIMVYAFHNSGGMYLRGPSTKDQGELYVDWKPYKHPTYGDIEIGGWVKMSSRLPHPFMLQNLVHRNASAVMFSSEQTLEIRMEIFEKTSLGKDLYRIRVRLHNSKAIPSMSYRSVQKYIYPQDMLKVSGNGIKVISGGKLTDIFRDRVTYKEHKPEIQFCQVPGFGKVEFQFLVSGKGKVRIDYESRKAGKLTETVDLQNDLLIVWQVNQLSDPWFRFYPS